MAQASNYFPSQSVELYFQKEAAVGVSPDDADLKKLQVTSFTIPEASVPVEYSSQRSGTFVTQESQGNHGEGLKLWTFDTVLKGTLTSVRLATEALFEDSGSDGTAILMNTYSFPTTSYKDGEAANTFELRFEQAGSDSSENNIRVNGCIATGMTLTEDIGSEGGELVCTINWATAYYPTYTSAALGGTTAYDGDTPKNIRNLNISNTTIDSEEVVLQSFEISATRTIERIHYQNTTSGDYKPFGYVMTGGWEVTGSLTCVRNDDIHDLKAKFINGSTAALSIGESSGTNFLVSCPKVYINETTIDNGGAVLMQSIPFTAVGNDDLSSGSALLQVNIANS